MVRHGLYHCPVTLCLARYLGVFAAASPYCLIKAANDKSVLRENPRVDRLLPPHMGSRARNSLDPATGGSPWLFVEFPF